MYDSTPNETPPATPGASRGRKITIAALVTAGLATGGVIAAQGSFASGGSSGGSSGSASAPANAPANALKPPAAPNSADLDGVVTAASSDSVTVRNEFGTSRTFVINDDTTVHNGAKKGSASSLQVGQRVGVRASKSGSTYTAKDIDIRAAHIDGVVKSISGDTVTVTDHDGFTRTIALDSSTTFTKDGKSADRSDLTGSSVISARGAVDSDGTTLDASSVDIRTKAATPPAGGPGGHGPAALPGKGGPAAPKGKTGGSGSTKAPTPPSGAPSGVPSGAPKAPSGEPSGAPSAAPSGGASSGS